MENLASLPPDRLFELFESGAIDRETLQTLMALQARMLIREMEEDHLNPAAAFMEHLRNLRMAIKFSRRHGQKLIRDVLSSLGRDTDFPPCIYLWNASHPDVPLHCFFRSKREPVFRILKMTTDGSTIHVEVEYGVKYPKAIHRETITLKRDAAWNLRIESRETLAVK
ncbi:hypothetical protein KBB96_01165 [Luteolibacter ambystomatis]|uniref:Uncharacterized protein n=1 Tax=Luteolibacter ambystomatis TaxID=2824561 RepID=A0A975G9T2_9BACT|nr:hypothetical protein [Luteolibacter ambystomatis]QUE51517.1 hypothetical protein KBB96_01165 [Luteolibacter ambystomatis]